MAAGDLTTLDNLKLWAPIPSTTTAEDALLSRLITAVSNDFARATKRPDLLASDYTEVHTGDGAARMIAFHWPINSIATLTVGGTAITESADKIAAGWYLDEDIDPERVWNVYLVNSVFTDGAPVKLEYNAGYAVVPEDIEQAIIDAMYVGFNANREFTTDDIAAALKRQVPLSISQRETIDYLRDWLHEGRAQSASIKDAQAVPTSSTA